MALLMTVGANSCPNADANHANVTSCGTFVFLYQKKKKSRRRVSMKKVDRCKIDLSVYKYFHGRDRHQKQIISRTRVYKNENMKTS